MTKFSVIFIGMVAVLFFQGCASHDQNPGSGGSDSRYRTWARDYSSRDPAQEAKSDFAKGLFGIFSAKGYSLYYPGLDFEVGEGIAKKFGVKHISGTSDVIESNAHREYNLAAFYFGSEYNRKKLGLLKGSGKL